jgi:hypothetical protein
MHYPQGKVEATQRVLNMVAQMTKVSGIAPILELVKWNVQKEFSEAAHEKTHKDTDNFLCLGDG